MDDNGVEVGKVTITGWKAVVVLMVLAVVVIGRFSSFGEQVDDKKLMKNLEVQILCDYLPGETAALKAAMAGGDEAEISRVAKSVTTAKVQVESVQASYPIFNFSSSKEVVVKVTYSLKDSTGTRGRKTAYYRYEYSSLLKHWSYQYQSSKIGYYLNLM